MNDNTQITINERGAIEYWTKYFDVNEHDLRCAIQAVGYTIADLERWIEKRKHNKAKAKRVDDGSA